MLRQGSKQVGFIGPAATPASHNLYLTDCHSPLHGVSWSSHQDRNLVRSRFKCLPFSAMKIARVSESTQPYQVFCLVALSTAPHSLFCISSSKFSLWLGVAPGAKNHGSRSHDFKLCPGLQQISGYHILAPIHTYLVTSWCFLNLLS